ncbi:MAG TPA: hypothetical protein VHR66_29945 [Gemmataceae bacterium]|jgi:hypothetical protein|nr:hypothetical protein [Gemmataceae bacterium]
MAAPKSKRTAIAPRHPEQKYGPFHGGVGVAVWLNEVQTDNGPKYFRSVTIAPRRYRDPKTGDWKDAGSLRSSDLPALILGLQAAQQFISSASLPGQPIEDDQTEPAAPEDNGKIPF